MKNGKISKISIILLVSITGFIISCSKKSSAVAPIGQPIFIDTKQKEFRGDPITIVAQFDPPVVESDVSWYHKGEIVSRGSSEIGNRVISDDVITLTYNNLGSFALKNAADTIYIRLKSNTDMVSNSVIISLLNHKPVLDSVRVNNIRVFKTGARKVRMHLNTWVGGELVPYAHDADNDPVGFRVWGLDSFGHTVIGSDSQWILDPQARDTVLDGLLEIFDGRGGTGVCSLEAVIYSEAHTLWVASTNKNDTSLLSKLTQDGRYLFSLDRFQQVKYVRVFPTSVKGSESVWVVDWTRKSLSAGNHYFSDTVFIVDDDGIVKHAVGGFKDHIQGFSLNLNRNIGYVLDGDSSIRKIDQDGRMSALYARPSAGVNIEVIESHPVNEDEYWIATFTIGDSTRRVRHMGGSTVLRTLNHDSLLALTGIATSYLNDIYWIAEDSQVVVARMSTDTVLATISGFNKPYVVACQLAGLPYCWVADRGNSKLYRLSFTNGATAMSGHMAISSSGPFWLEAAAAGSVSSTGTNMEFQESISLDYNATPPALWVADFNGNRVIKVNAVSGGLLGVFSMMDLELENPEAISVNVIVY